MTARLLLPLVLLLLAACGGPDVSAPKGNAVALRVEQVGGGPRQLGATDFPQYVLYGDGTLIAANGIDGAMPVSREYHLNSSAFQRIYARARSAGLDVAHDYETQAPDAPVLVITFGHDTTQSVTHVIAPDPDASGPAGDKVRAVQLNPDDLADRDFTSPPEPYKPARMAVVSSPRQAAADTVAWPFQSLAEGTPVNGGRCAVYTEPLVTQINTLGRTTRPGAAWTHDGATYSVFFRPLLPDEPGCAALDVR